MLEGIFRMVLIRRKTKINGQQQVVLRKEKFILGTRSVSGRK